MFRKNKAASTTEYGLLFALISILLLSTVAGTGKNLATLFSGIDTALNTQKAAAEGGNEDALITPSLPEQDENCDKGNVSQASVDTLNAWVNRTYSLSTWCDMTAMSFFNLGLGDIPAEIGQLTQLQTISLYGNNITTVPKEIGYLTNVTVISLADNQITSLPVELALLPKLVSLQMAKNALSDFPAANGFPMLRNLYLQQNNLVKIPTSVLHLERLYNLNIENNDIQSGAPADGLMQIDTFKYFYTKNNPDLVFSERFCTFADSLTTFSHDDSVCPY